MQFVDIKDEVTVRDEVDEKTGLRQLVIMEHKEKSLQPPIDILDKAGAPMVALPAADRRAPPGAGRRARAGRRRSW